MTSVDISLFSNTIIPNAVATLLGAVIFNAAGLVSLAPITPDSGAFHAECVERHRLGVKLGSSDYCRECSFPRSSSR